MLLKKLEFGVMIILGLGRGQMVEDHKAGTKTEPSLYVLRPICMYRPCACMLSEKGQVCICIVKRTLILRYKDVFVPKFGLYHWQKSTLTMPF